MNVPCTSSSSREPWLSSGPARLLAGLSAIGAVALTAAASSGLFPGEQALLRWLIANVEPWFGPFSAAMDDAFTDWSATAVFALLVPVVWFLWGRWPTAVFVIAGALTGLTRLGNLANRPRPTGKLEWGSVASDGGGYPSGHVIYFVLVFGMLAFFALWLPSPLPRRATAAILVGLIAAVGPSRLVELDHWPADVVGAYLIAFPALVTTITLYIHGPRILAR